MSPARLSPLSPPAAAIRRAVQQELALNPPKVEISANELARVGIPALKQWFRLDECATIFAVSTSQVRNWIDAGVLEARGINSVIDPTKPPERKHKRVTRESVVRLLNDRSRTV
jgi:hypothetical protein